MDILLHICCAPCSLYSWQALESKGHHLQGLFFNPNIHPFREFKKRKDALKSLAEEEKRPIFIDERYLLNDYLRQVVNREELRCELCYAMRLEETARLAKEKDIEGISTTLLISPYQQHELLRVTGGKIAEEYGLKFVYEDLRPGFRESMGLAREKGLYMQGYCGCIYSERDRYNKDSGDRSQKSE